MLHGHEKGEAAAAAADNCCNVGAYGLEGGVHGDAGSAKVEEGRGVVGNPHEVQSCTFELVVSLQQISHLFEVVVLQQ